MSWPAPKKKPTSPQAEKLAYGCLTFIMGIIMFWVAVAGTALIWRVIT